MKKPRVHRLLAGILCAAMITQNLTVISLASEPEPAVVQETEAEAGLEESTDLEENTEPEAVEEESEAEEPEKEEEKNGESEQKDTESTESREPATFDGETGDAVFSDGSNLISTYSDETETNPLVKIRMDAAYQQTEARKMLDLVNEFRTSGNAWYWDITDTTKIGVGVLNELQWDYNLEEVAMQRAAEISLWYEAHTRTDGTSALTAFENGSGYTYTWRGENLSYGSGTGVYDEAEEAFDGWKEEYEIYAGQGHRRNMLSEHFNAIGIAEVVSGPRHFWVMELGYADPPCTKATDAEDGTRSVDIQIAASLTDRITVPEIEVEVPYGGSTEIPEISANVLLQFSQDVEIYADWEVDDPSIADIEDGMIRGKKVGSTALRMTLFPGHKKEQEVTARVTVTPLELTDADVTIEKDTYEYTGKAIEPEVTVTWKKTRLTEGTDYTVAYDNNRSNGTASVTVTGTGIYGGTVTKYFTINCDHQYDDGVVVTEPDCTHEGVRKYTCKICGDEKTESIKATGHTAALIPAVEPTCIESGLTEGEYCTVCNEVLKEQKVIPALGHDFVNGVCTRGDAKKPVLSEKDFTVTIPDSLIYDGKAKPVTVKLTEGITDAGTITVSYYQNGEKLSGAPVNAGTYEVHISVEESDTYYKSEDLHLAQWDYTIKKAKVTIKADDATVKKGKALPMTYTYKVTGLIGDDELGFEPQIYCEAADSSEVGNYEIRPYGTVELDNYTIAYETGTLVIEENIFIAQGTIDETYGTITWVIDAEGELTVEGHGDVAASATDISTGRIPWYAYRAKITSAKVKVTGMKNAANLFFDCKNMTSVDLSGFDTSQTTNMYRMFGQCRSLEQLDLSSMNTSSAVNMRNMFFDCRSLKALDLGSFDTSKVTDMGVMFKTCTALEELNVSSFDTSNVADTQYMFSGCASLKYLDVSSFRTEKVKKASDMFSNCTSLTGLDLSVFDFKNASRVWKLVYGDTGLTYLCTPKNMPTDENNIQDLPGNKNDKWYDLKGNVVTTIPAGQTESVTFYKNNKEVLKQPIGLVAEKEKTIYEWGEELTLDDLNVAVRYMDESSEVVSGYTTNADSIDMSEPGEKKLHIVYGDMTTDVKITVTAKQLNDTNVIFNDLPEYTYDGKEKTPAVEAYYDGQMLVPEVDYTVSYENNKNAGQGTVWITGRGKYAGTVKTEFTIQKAVLTVTAPDRTVVQGARLTDDDIACSVDGLYGTDSLVKKPTYTCAIDTDTVGIYPDVIVPSGADAGSNYEIIYVNGTLTVTERQTPELAVKEILKLDYTGSALKPVLTVYDTDTGAVLKNGKDYTIKYYHNVNADQIEAVGGISDKLEKDDEIGFDPQLPYAVVTGKGNYQGVLYVNFHILPVKLDKVTLRYNEQLTANEKKAQKVISSIKYKKPLKEGVDYTVEGNVIPAGAAGTFVLKIEGTGNYTGIIERGIYVADKTKLLKYAVITVDKASKKQVYDGKEKTLAFTVRMGKAPLTEGTDYTVSYENNDAVGTATMTITGMGEYLGTKSVDFRLTGTKLTAKNLKVVALNENGETVDISQYTAEYSGKEIKLENLTVILQKANEPDTVLTEGIDYELTYKDHVNVGRATVTIKAGKASVYEGSVSKTFQITPASLDKTEKELQQTAVYEKAGARAELTLTYGGQTLQEGKDYTVKCKNNLIAEDRSNPPVVTVTGKGNYTGTWSANYSIVKKSLKEGVADGTITVDVKALAFTNAANAAQTYRPTVKVYDGKKVLTVGKDYTVSYRNNTNGELNEELSNGEVVVRALNNGNYRGSITVSLPIYAEKISSSTIYTIIEPAVYTGGQVRPQIRIYYGTAQAVKYAKTMGITDPEKLNALDLELLHENVDYKLSYGANVAAGKNKGSMKIIGTGWYGGSASVKFTIQAKQL